MNVEYGTALLVRKLIYLEEYNLVIIKLLSRFLYEGLMYVKGKWKKKLKYKYATSEFKLSLT